MSKIRMRMAEPGEKKADIQKFHHIIEPHLVDFHFTKHANDKKVCELDLKTKMGSLLYLKNLAQVHTIKEGDENQEPCPICQHNLGHEWFVLKCGHSYCKDCHFSLIKNENPDYKPISMSSSSNNRIVYAFKCPLCRQNCVETESYHVCTKTKMNELKHERQHANLNPPKSKHTFNKNLAETKELSSIKIKGDASSAKVEMIVKCLVKILIREPKAKCLVFSENLALLELIHNLLTENLILFRLAKDATSLQRHIIDFKRDPNINVLLLPYSFGSNGLNIIEATHVLLVEPTLNRAQEMQAIGRVHRIGQTKHTTVYRFFANDTIEQFIFEIFKNTNFSRPENHQEISEKILTMSDVRDLILNL
jgi:E3 ubiquitin-protein ligase SHPRH